MDNEILLSNELRSDSKTTLTQSNRDVKELTDDEKKQLQMMYQKVKAKFSIGFGAFLSSVFFAVGKKFETEDNETASTDGINIYINPFYFLYELKNDDERVFVIAHEVLHIVYQHFFRMEGKDPELWNCATDYVINSHLVKSKYFGDLPEGLLYDKRFDEMQAEQIYDILDKEESAEIKKIVKIFLYNDLDPTRHSKKSKNSNSSIYADIKNIIIQSYDIAQMENDIDSFSSSLLHNDEFRNLIVKLKNPVQDWKTVLRDYFSKSSKGEHSWMKRNRRYHDAYLPSRYSLGAKNIRVFIDESASVNNNILNALFSEVKGIKEDLNISLITVIPFTDKLHLDYRVDFTEGDDVKYPRKALCGGTDVYPIFELLLEEERGNSEFDELYDINIIFSDGFFDYKFLEENQYANIDVLWCIYAYSNKQIEDLEFKPALGKVCYLIDDKFI